MAVYMSVCEDAMQQRATGSTVPLAECWGCTNHPTFHTSRHHLYRECPNKNDQQVRANKAIALQAFLERRQSGFNSDNYQPAPRVGMVLQAQNWEADGFPSPRTSALIATIADP
eukprot:scaffold421990_cov67-Attheya_sp.AAC.1